jgi:hypothetical protein
MVGGTVSAHGSTIVREVISSTSSGADVMSALPGLVRQLLDEGAWRKFTIPGGTVVEHATFGAFVQANPPGGLGGRKRQLAALCGTDEELADRVRALLKGEISAAAEHGGDRKSEEFQDGGTNLKPSRSNDAEQTVARLKRDDPSLAEKVVIGEMSAYSAARSKGWKPPRIQVTSPERVAEKLRDYMPRDARERLAQLLLATDAEVADEDGQPR